MPCARAEDALPSAAIAADMVSASVGGLIQKVVGAGSSGRRSAESGRVLLRTPHLLPPEDEAPAASCSGVSSRSPRSLVLLSQSLIIELIFVGFVWIGWGKG